MPYPPVPSSTVYLNPFFVLRSYAPIQQRSLPSSTAIPLCIRHPPNIQYIAQSCADSATLRRPLCFATDTMNRCWFIWSILDIYLCFLHQTWFTYPASTFATPADRLFYTKPNSNRQTVNQSHNTRMRVTHTHTYTQTHSLLDQLRCAWHS